mmetsp:Transcript_67/g.271  ORF Transcript_67/g.271 Transcript_67/m.271 type:complete len:348 (+) Transcript_67:2057-3100(+)
MFGFSSAHSTDLSIHFFNSGPPFVMFNAAMTSCPVTGGLVSQHSFNSSDATRCSTASNLLTAAFTPAATRSRTSAGAASGSNAYSPAQVGTSASLMPGTTAHKASKSTARRHVSPIFRSAKPPSSRVKSLFVNKVFARAIDSCTCTVVSASFERSLSALLMMSPTAGTFFPFFPSDCNSRYGNNHEARYNHTRFSSSIQASVDAISSSAPSTHLVEYCDKRSAASVTASTTLCVGTCKTIGEILNAAMSATASAGERPLSIPKTSFPKRSRLTLCFNACCTSGSLALAPISSSTSKPNRAAKRTARKIRNGSSKNVVRGGSGVRTTPRLKSSIPRSVKSSTFFSLML